jgi:hypothetical protein
VSGSFIVGIKRRLVLSRVCSLSTSSRVVSSIQRLELSSELPLYPSIVGPTAPGGEIWGNILGPMAGIVNILRLCSACPKKRRNGRRGDGRLEILSRVKCKCLSRCFPGIDRYFELIGNQHNDNDAHIECLQASKTTGKVPNA